MLGHIKPSDFSCSPLAKGEYKKLYCSVCSSMQKQFGILASGLLVHELVLAILFLKNNFNPEEKREKCCPLGCFLIEKDIYTHQVIDSAARLSLLSVWLKITDSVIDEPNLFKRILYQMLDKKAQEAFKNVSDETENFFYEYCESVIPSTDFQYIRKMSGLLAKKILMEMSSLTDIQVQKKEMFDIFQLTGELVLIGDSLLDFTRDIEHGQYNPIIKSGCDIVAYKKYFQEYLLCEKKLRNMINKIQEKNSLFVIEFLSGIDGFSERIYKQKKEVELWIL